MRPLGAKIKAIYPSTVLKNQQREVKAVADNEIVHITENGWGKYVFISEEVFAKALERAVEETFCEKRIAEVLSESRNDFEEGQSCFSREDLMTAASKKCEAGNDQA